MFELLNRTRRLLGVHDVLIVVAFLAANTFVEVVLDLPGSPVLEVIWLVALCAATLGLAMREVQRTGRGVALSSCEFGVYAERSLGGRRAAVVVVGLDSDRPDSALARLLLNAERLEYLALIGTHETRAAGVCERIEKRLLAATGRHLHADRDTALTCGRADAML